MVRRRNRRMQVCIPALVLAIIFFILSMCIHMSMLAEGVCWWRWDDEPNGILDYIVMIIIIIAFTVYEYFYLEEMNAKNQLWLHLFVIPLIWALKIIIIGAATAIFGAIFIQIPIIFFRGIFYSGF